MEEVFYPYLLCAVFEMNDQLRPGNYSVLTVAYHAQCCNSGDYPAVGTPSVVYVVYGRCNVLNDASRTNQQELEIGNTIVKKGWLSSAPRLR